MQRIVIVMAMRAEAAGVVRALGATPEEPPGGAGPLPGEWYRARHRGLDVVLAVNGVDPFHGVDRIGSDPAALTTFVSLAEYRPDLVVSAGTAGGWAGQGTRIGDVFVSRGHFVHHDRRIDLPGFDVYGIGSHPAVDASALAWDLGLRQGIVTTGGSLDEMPEDRARMAASGAALKEMEAATVAGVARLFGIPVMAVKAVTDLVDDHEEVAAQFQANLAVACERLCEAVVRVVDWCAGRTINDLGGAEP